MEMKRRQAVDGKVVIVTGASSGIGESTAREFAGAGATVVLAARRKERLDRLQNKIEEMGGRALAIPTDLTQPVTYLPSISIWHVAGGLSLFALVSLFRRRKR